MQEYFDSINLDFKILFMKKSLLPFFLTLFTTTTFSQLNMQLLDQMTYSVNVNDVWGWADPDSNAEYAFVGMNTGVSIVDVTNPTDIQEVQFITGPNSTWRDIKTWSHFAYVTNETGGGLLVIDMSGAPDNITWEYKIFNIPGWGNLTDCHNLFIDEYGYCYLAGCNLNGGQMLTILDVFTNSANPTVVYSNVANYAHDYFAQNNILYASEIYGGDLGIYDVSNKQNINLLASQQTPYNFTHNAWVNAENTVVFTTDEKANAPVAAYDITDLNDIRELDQFRPIATLNKNVIPHNVHVWDNWLIISYYTDGGIIADASRPENIIEVGNWDTFLGGNGNYNGAWGAYPFLPSGIVLLSDRQSGLLVCGANYVRACWLEGKITNALTGATIFGAEVSIASSQANFTTSDLTGNYKTGQALPGTFYVTFSAMGYISKTVPAVLENGVLTILDVELEPIVPVDEFSGQVVSAVDGSPIAAAQVVLESGTFRFTAITDIDGEFVFSNIFRDVYTIAAAKWGYKHALMVDVLIDQNTDPVTLSAHRGYQDDFFSSQGWTTQTTASSGWWTRDIPIGTSLNGELANPDADVPDDIGNQCFMTGNNGGDPGNDDVDDGYVRLISPMMDMTIYYDPIVSYNTWFVNVGNTGTPNDSFQVRISNGMEEVVLETITTSNAAWNDRSEFKISDYLDITNNMKVIFEASDDAANGHIVEAAVDAFLVEDSAFPMFEFTALEGCPVWEVGFDELSGYAYQWNWTFENGDPSTSTQASELVGFATPGPHDIALEVTTNTGSVFTLEYSDFVNVLELPTSGFNFTNNGGQVSFENTSTNASSFFWSFNDGSGTTSDLQNPSHTFPAAGSYEVTLAATNDCGTSYSTQTVFIDAVPPTANLSVGQTVGCEPFIVEFYDESDNVPTVWNWSFPGGDPAFSTEQNPVVTYPTSGTYNVQLAVTNSAGSSEISVTDLILVKGVPAPGFGFTVNGPTVVFENNSVNADLYSWQFNDGFGGTSDLENPTHIFPDIGEYEVVLSATNDCGTINYTQTVVITAIQPTAYFTVENGVGCFPLTVQYFDQSMGGEISGWQWSFPSGNPASSSEQNPIVTYTVPSSYNASLVVNNPVGQAELFLFDVVTVNDIPFASFTYSAIGPTIEFSSVLLDADNWIWHFGDANGSTSTDANPTFEYDEIGTYSIVLEATNACGTFTVEQEIIISAIAPTASFQTNINAGCAPLEVSFTDVSSGGGISAWEWGFPGGTPSSSNEQNPTVIYNSPGYYDVSLHVANPVGESDILLSELIFVQPGTESFFDFSINGPEVQFVNLSIFGTSYEWVMNDGTGSVLNDVNPFYTFPGVGEYQVTLNVTNDCGTSSYTGTVVITSSTSTSEKEVYIKTFYAAPNPFSNATKVIYEIGQPFKNGQFILTNILGEILTTKPIFMQKGEIYFGEKVDVKGVYFLQMVIDGNMGDALKIVKY